MDDGCRIYGGSDHITALLQHNNNQLPCSSDGFESLWFPSPSPSFQASDTMVDFQNAQGRTISTPDGPNPNLRPRKREETGDDGLDDSSHQPEKKRRLSAEQVQSLERTFEVENKLEPERKVQLAKELGLQARQVGIWFQNRRARYKTKQLEKDYDLLKANYDCLQTHCDNLIKENEGLKDEVTVLANMLKLREKQTVNTIRSEPPPAMEESEDVGKRVTMAAMCKQEEASSVKSDIVDSESPHCAEGNHSFLLENEEPANSSHIFEPDPADFSQDEEDQHLSRSLLSPLPLPPPPYGFPKLEERSYSAADLHGNSGCIGLPVDDHHFWSCFAGAD
ncbi:hypothetical protein Nepgr_017169 [Nepenthes gracilis]|uniref:Homeobox-leucine zipper protein n=1 Tax=Nepenthes gracilis TaxID=150966 RepID=A0AAD3XS89_NEPGR|nr:hypothetical protein Nepgr_017169 [Nepenthes gracilis]